MLLNFDVYLREDVTTGNAKLVPLFAEKVETLDDDYQWICSESVKRSV